MRGCESSRIKALHALWSGIACAARYARTHAGVDRH